MWNRKYETQTRINARWNPVNKVFAYTTNTLNQYQDRVVYTGSTTDTEIIPETNTGILEDTTSTWEIEVINTEIVTWTWTDTNTWVTNEETITDETPLVDLQWRLIYDNNWNMIWNLLNNKRQYIYSYDYKNRLIKVEKNIYTLNPTTQILDLTKTNIIEYKYDVLGRRIKKINNNLTYTKYYYSNQNLIQEE